MDPADRLIPLLLAVCWPVPALFDRCPVRAALWLTALARADLEDDVMRAAFRLLDLVPTARRE